jgi:DNA-binding GntR family transcriptional regulator
MERAERSGARVYATVKRRLLDGRYRPGERLNADSLAGELGVSRQPVFDTFKLLSAEGLVTVRPHVGCHVAVYGIDEVRDYFHLFAAVEGAASAMAARRRTDDQIRSLRRLHAQIGGLAALDDPEERAHGYRALNREFHSLVHTMCGTPIVERFGSGMYDRADFFVNASANVSPFAHSVPERHDEHARIVAGIETADADLAQAAASEHILSTLTLIDRAVERFGERLAA